MEFARLFEDNFDFAFNAATYNNMKVAIRAYEQFVKENEDFFSFDKGKSLFGRLRAYAVERQFYQSAFKPRAGYSVIVKPVRFLYKGIIIKHNKTEPTYTKTSLFLCEKRRFFYGPD